MSEAVTKAMIPPACCTYDDFGVFVFATRAEVLALADVGKFPGYVRLAGRKSPPIWVRSQVLQYIKDKFGKLLPDFVREVELSGLLVPSTKSKIRRPKPEARRYVR